MCCEVNVRFIQAHGCHVGIIESDDIAYDMADGGVFLEVGRYHDELRAELPSNKSRHGGSDTIAPGCVV